ncbi:MAG: Hsp70 family protein [Chitinophagaceae bacterium]|nr:Hsp70 family protein [Chitinophagaceae bacterium]
MKPVNFGIDLGTTNSLIAKYEASKVTVFKNPVGQKETLASVVAYRPDRVLVGDKAREYLVKDPVNVFGSFKRKMGTDEKYYVVNIDDNVTPVQLSSLVLKELKNFIHTGETPEACVITIPASFDTMQSNATLKAGQEAGFKDIFLLQEPIAASLAFFNETAGEENKDGYWLVYDFGGGTFDAALVQSTDQELKVVDHEGNNFLGGVDFDFAIIDMIVVPEIIRQTGITDFEQEFRVKYGKYEKLFYEVMYYAEEAKKELSATGSAYIEFSTELDGKKYDFSIPVTKEKAGEIFLPIINETIKLLNNVLRNNGLTPKDIRQVILVGGSTFLPQVKEQLAEQTGISLNSSVDPTTAIAVGAAWYAANKQYEPSIEETAAEHTEQAIETANDILSNVDFSPPDLKVEVSYNKSSRDKEEVLLIFCEGTYEDKYYRLVRSDGGFDSGFVQLKAKKTEFLPLIPSVTNHFTLAIFDKNYDELKSLAKEIHISQGKYAIDGQPLPHDISIEVDDVENKTTRLEAIFERNSLLPQKRTLYREISKTIKKGSKDSIIISILEGDKNSRPLSNLTIGCIEIAGKDLKTDLVKGSDIEIQLHITDSRVLNTTVFLVMTQQEFKNVFSISEKKINLERLKEQYTSLEHELTNTVKEFQYNQREIWEIKANALLEELHTVKERLFRLKKNDKSDEKYIIAEKIMRLSQEADKLGGNERISLMIEDYYYRKDQVKETINTADFEKEELKRQFIKIEQSEASFIRSKNVSFIQTKLEQLYDLHWKALGNTTSFLITKFVEFRDLGPEYYRDYNGAKSLIKLGNAALEKENYPEFRRHVYSLSGLLHRADFQMNSDFKGTGIG